VKRISPELRSLGREWYLYEENDADWRLQRVDMVDLTAWERDGFRGHGEGRCLGRPISLWDRDKSSVMDELRLVLQSAMSLPFKKAVLTGSKVVPGRR
jgi:hypothetical protein